MKFKKLVCIASVLFLVTMNAQADYFSERYTIESGNPYLATDSRYDYIYGQAPRQGLRAYGYYMGVISGVRYAHSPSKLKGARHAARINAYNYNNFAYGY